MYVLKLAGALFVFLWTFSHAQSNQINETLKKVNTSLKNCHSVKMDVSYTYYPNHTSQKAVEVEKGEIWKKGNLQYSTLLGTQTVINDKYQIIIDSVYKRIIVSDRDKKLQSKQVSDLDLTKLLSQYEKPIDISNSKLAGYRFRGKQNIASEHEMVDVYYNRKTYVIEKLVFYYAQEMPVHGVSKDSPKQKPRLEICFFNINLSAGLKESDFSETKYFSVNTGKFTATSTFKKYSIIKNNARI